MEVMAARHDILDRPESLKNPLFLSVGLHVTLAAAAVIYALLPATEIIRWGDPSSLGGGSVSINPVRSIPLPPRAGRVNPLANDTPSQAPAPPPQEVAKPKPAPREAPDAIALQGRETPRRPAAPLRSYRSSAVSPRSSGSVSSVGRPWHRPVEPSLVDLRDVRDEVGLDTPGPTQHLGQPPQQLVVR